MVINDSLIINIWHLDHTIVLNYFKDYDFRIMDFPVGPGGKGSVGGQFPHIFGWTTWGAAQNLGRFAEDLHTAKLDGEACVLRCVYLFICLLFVYLLFVFCLFFNYF